MLKAITLSICAALLLRAPCHAAELAQDTAPATPATPTPDFQSLRINGLAIALPGPQDTIDPDFAGLRSSLASLVSVVVSRNVFSHYLVDAALQRGQLAHTGNYSITAAYNASIATGIRGGIGLGYTNNPTPVIYRPQTGSAFNLLANMVVYW